MTTAYFREKQQTLQQQWVCPDCTLTTRRCGNDETPAKPAGLNGNIPQTTLDVTNMSCDETLNISNIHGETQFSPSAVSRNREASNHGNVTLEQLSALLDEKLDIQKQLIISEMNAKIMSEMRTLIQQEIQDSINYLKAEITGNLKKISTDQKALKSEIGTLKMRIESLEAECSSLKTEKETSIIYQPPSAITIRPEVDNSKKIVLYGVEESRWENENELEYMVTNIFFDTLNVNLEGYIEDILRIGKKGYRRPIVIELISKKMSKYILRNSSYFRDFGLAVAPYLDADQSEKRREMRKILIAERKSGNHAIIRDNKLFINGREHKHIQQSQQGNQHTTANQVPHSQQLSASADQTTKNNVFNTEAGSRSFRI
jgi:hypothetical protein